MTADRARLLAELMRERYGDPDELALERYVWTPVRGDPMRDPERGRERRQEIESALKGAA